MAEPEGDDMNNKKWNILIVCCLAYVFISGATVKLLQGNPDTEYLATPFLEVGGLIWFLYALTLVSAVFVYVLKVVRDRQEERRVDGKTFLKALFAYSIVIAFVVVVNVVR
ncbi:hypothetical protein [Alteribacter aurantiacus]|uniref:hypothetical protein n=1 Tax=Alteribacter aurantiacus TaxID=254410 RepID=UPI0004033442|nr:hypothetical protein [Alteribacter aurantiacus]